MLHIDPVVILEEGLLKLKEKHKKKYDLNKQKKKYDKRLIRASFTSIVQKV